MIASKMWPLECKQGFLLIWPGDLVFDSKWPSFELDLEIIKTNIWSKIHDDWFKNVTSKVLTRFSFDLTWWPSFWPQVTQFQTLPHQDKLHDDCFKNVTSRVLTSFSFDLAWWPSFWPQVTQYETWSRFHRGKHSKQVSLRLGQNCDL